MESTKAPYEKPALEDVGSLSDLTLGNVNGNSQDNVKIVVNDKTVYGTS